MTAITEGNVVAYSIAVDMKRDAVIGIIGNDDSVDESDDNSDTDTDGNCVILRPSVLSSMTTLADDDLEHSNDSSDEYDKYIDTVASRSEEATSDDEERDIFVDAAEERSRENVRKALFVVEMSENVIENNENEIEQEVSEITPDFIQADEVVQTDRAVAILNGLTVDVIDTDHNDAQECSNTHEIIETSTSETQETDPSEIQEISEAGVNIDNQEGLVDLEELDGEIEYFDAYAVFSPFVGGKYSTSRIIYSNPPNYCPDEPEDTNAVSNEALDNSESFTQTNHHDNETIVVGDTYIPNANIGIGIEYASNECYVYTDAVQVLPSCSAPDNLQISDTEPTPMPCILPDGLMGQPDGSMVYAQQQDGIHDKTPPELTYCGQEEAVVSRLSDNNNEQDDIDNPQEASNLVVGCHDIVGEIEPVSEDAIPVVQIESESFTTEVHSNSEQADAQVVDTTSTSPDCEPSMFPNSSLNPESEPFVPSCNIQYVNDHDSYAASCQTTDSHQEVPSDEPITYYQVWSSDLQGQPDNSQGQPQMFSGPGHALFPIQYMQLSNGYNGGQATPMACSPQFPYGTDSHRFVHPAYPFYPSGTNMDPTATGSDTEPTFQPVAPQASAIGQIPPHVHSAVYPASDFQYPSIYLSQAGLITVLLRNDFSVEMTIDQVVRVVNHKKKFVALINSEGTDSYLFHPAASITQDPNGMEVSVFLQRKVKMTPDHVTFGNNFKCFKFDYDDIEETQPEFSDMGHDRSVNFLFVSSSQSDTITVERAAEIADEANIEHEANGCSVVRINGFKIVQNERGEVIVTSGPKFIKMCVKNMSLHMKSAFIDVAIGINWSVNIRQGSNMLNASHCGFIVSNGRIEAGFDDANKPFACLLPRRVPLLSDHRKYRRRHRDTYYDRRPYD